jgi:hypothetical protein
MTTAGDFGARDIRQTTNRCKPYREAIVPATSIFSIPEPANRLIHGKFKAPASANFLFLS